MSKDEIQRALFKRGKKPPGLETPIVRDVLQFLNVGIRNCVAWRQNTGGMRYRRVDGSEHQMFFGTPGMGDVSGLLRGFRLEVEVKRPGKEPTPLQAAWLDMIRVNGGVSFWCNSIPTCIARLEEEFERRGWVWGT